MLELDPNYYLAYQYLGFTHLQKGEIDEGIQACEMAARAVGQGPWPLAYRAIASAKAGRIDEVTVLLEQLRDLSQRSYVTPIIFSWIYSSLGEIDRTLEWIEKGIDERLLLILYLHIDPIYDPLRTHPCYHALLRRMILEP